MWCAMPVRVEWYRPTYAVPERDQPITWLSRGRADQQDPAQFGRLGCGDPDLLVADEMHVERVAIDEAQAVVIDAEVAGGEPFASPSGGRATPIQRHPVQAVEAEPLLDHLPGGQREAK